MDDPKEEEEAAAAAAAVAVLPVTSMVVVRGISNRNNVVEDAEENRWATNKVQ